MVFDWAHLAKLMFALLAIVDVPGNVPLFLQQTHGLNHRGKKVAAIAAGVATCAILLIFAHVGEIILGAFNITLDAFRIVGGIVLLLIALDMLGILSHPVMKVDPETPQSPIVIGVFPMAVPLFAGPGAITTVMIYAHAETAFYDDHEFYVSMVIIAVCAVIVAGLLLAASLARFIGPTAQSIINRLLGMIVGALGVEFILEGVQGFFGLA